ncbi:MAG: hypothetical protein FWD25_01510 [Clostridia bacterium]|nr:hypothetical protein [Clostridia bacterium]
MRKIICMLLAACLCCACVLPMAVFAADTDPNPAQTEALAAFERFAALRLERGMQATLPGEATTSETGGSVYEPFGDFVFKAFYHDENEEWPMYLCGSASNDSFDGNELWAIFQDCMRAVEPALTEEISYELMEELAFDMRPVAEDMPDVYLGVVFYGRWRFSLTTLEHGEEGPTLAVLPVEPYEEPKGTSRTRLDAVYSRFRSIAGHIGLTLAEDSTGEWDTNDPAGLQFIRELAEDAVWVEIYAGDVFGGQGIFMYPGSPLQEYIPGLFFALAFAIDPHLEANEIDAMYETLLEQTVEAPGGKTSRMWYYNTHFMLMESDGTLGLLAMRQSLYDEQQEDGRVNALSAGTAYHRFRQACEEAGYTLLPEEPYVVYDEWYVYTPMAGMEWGHTLDPQDGTLHFYLTATASDITFDEAMPFFAIAAQVIDPSWSAGDARAFMDGLRANLREDEDGDFLVCVDSRDGIIYMLMVEHGDEYTSLIMMVTP